MALSTSELVTGISSESSVEGQSGTTPISGPVSSAGTESWLWGVRLARPPVTVRRTFFLLQDEHRRHSLAGLLKNIVANPYLFDEGSAVSLFAFLFEGLPGVGAALFGDAPGAA